MFLPFRFNPLEIPGVFAVMVFFGMSSFVLARAYDGRPIAFLVRRAIRLWPLHASCIVVGSILWGELPRLGALLWISFPYVDPPAWSLMYEAWMTPFLPILFWAFKRRRWIGIVTTLFCLMLMPVDPRFLFVASFTSGVAAAQFAIRFPTHVSRSALFLGKISFSLYLTHQIVITEAVKLAGPWGGLLSLPVVFGVALLAWWAIEKPSIALSRRAGRSQFSLIRQ
jgi:peptidoglycan/LPS O-acetylase OafA/YrhL